MFRRPRFPSIQDFIQMFNIHQWSFLRAKFEMNPEEIRSFVQALELEADVMKVAWDGGDEYMQVLANHLTNAMVSHAQRTAFEVAAVNFVNSLGEEFAKYVEDLTTHDWYYRESDDITVYRRGLNREEQLKTLAARGDLWQLAYDTEAARYYKPPQKAALVKAR